MSVITPVWCGIRPRATTSLAVKGKFNRLCCGSTASICARCNNGHCGSGRWLSCTCPRVGAISPVSTFKRLDFPAPLGPTIAVTLPASTSRLILRNRSNPDKWSEILSASMVIGYTTLRCCNSSATKNGAPNKAVRMPVGNSAGITTIRAKLSAITSKVAPASAEAGTSQR